MEVIFVSDVLLAGIAMIWLLAATIQDIKKREVANWLNFSLIIIALAVRAFAAVISMKAYYFIYGLLALAGFFVIANIFYYARIFAGGDAKLLIALATAFATTPQFLSISYSIANLQLSFLATFVINMLFVGSVYGIVYSIVLALSHRKEFQKEFRKLNRGKNKLKIAFLVVFVLLVAAGLALKEGLFLMLSAIFLIFPYLLVFVKAVENACMVKVLKLQQITEGDWLFEEIRIGKTRIKLKWEGLSSKEIALIKKSKIKSLRIKQGLPFVPVFLIALITSFFTNLLVFLIQFFV